MEGGLAGKRMTIMFKLLVPALAALSLASAAHAKDFNETTVSVTVPYGDLDLASDEGAAAAPAAYTVEPSADVVLDTLVPRLVAVSLYHMLLESKASEHSARMVAMKNASDKSKEVAKDLTRQFNRIRQAQITREVSEIVSGREALAQ